MSDGRTDAHLLTQMGESMSDDLERLEAKIDDLSERLRRVEARVYGQGAPTSPRTQTDIPDRDGDDVAIRAPVAKTSGAAMLSFVGRSLIVLAGAFMLRWLTKRGTLPQEIGSIIGMIYALLWIILADRAAGRDRRESAVFHGVTGAMIALPLLVEATIKFHFLTPQASAISLGAFVIIGLAVAGRRSLRLLAWSVALPAAPLAFVLAARTEGLTSFLSCLLILGLVTLWLGYLRDWHVLAALIAGAANLGASLVVLDAIDGHRSANAPPLDLAASLFLLFSLIVVYFGSFCFRVFKRKRTIAPLEIVQSLTVIVIGLGGAAIVVNAGNYSMLPLGVGALVLSGTCYVAAYGFLPRLDPNRRNFLFFTMLGLATAILGWELTLPGPATAMTIAAIALAAGFTARRIKSPILYIHGAVFLLVAIGRSGLLATTIAGFAGASLTFGDWTSVAVLLSLAVTIVYPWFPRPEGRRVDVSLGRQLVGLQMLVTVCSLGAIIATLFVRVVPSAAASPALVANARTAILAVAAVSVAALSGRTRTGNLGWLVYTLLGLGAIKLALQDVPAGEATLFLSFAFYGSALIAAPRILRRPDAGADSKPH